jgi:hypothetical protein
MIPLSIVVGLLLSIAVNGGNITVDDSNSTIEYLPLSGWATGSNAACYNGSLHIGIGNATATFVFTGFYFAID